MTTIPTVKQIKDQLIADFQTEWGITIPEWKKAFLNALAVVLAFKLYTQYLLLGKVQKNIWVDTAEPELSGGSLERFGRVKLNRDPFPATQGKYEVQFTGVPGGLIRAGTIFIGDPTSHAPGKNFILDQDYTMPGETGSAVLRALESGTGSRLKENDTLSASSPIVNVDGGVLVITETLIPNSAEDLELYRQKAIERYRLEPQGSAPADYRIWGKDAAGVKEIYPYAKSGALHELNVYVESPVEDSTDGMGTPTSTILNDVKDCILADPISGDGRKPITVHEVNVLPVNICKVKFTVYEFQGLTPQKENLIFQGLTEAINKIRPFIGGADILANQNDFLSETKAIYIIQNTLSGATFSGISMEVAKFGSFYTPSQSEQFTNGMIPFLDEVVYA